MAKLFFHVEATGLPDFKGTAAHQPRLFRVMAELAEIEQDGDQMRYSTLQSFDELIKPDGWRLPDDIAEISGITQADLEQRGAPLKVVLEELAKMARGADAIVCHAKAVTSKHITTEMNSLGMNAEEVEWRMMPVVDICDLAKHVVNLPPSEKMAARGIKTPKPPKLEESLRFFQGLELSELRQQPAALWAVKIVYEELRQRGVAQ